MIKFLLFMPMYLLVLACGGIKNSQYYEYLSVTSEPPECLTQHYYNSTVTINGTAKFFKRGLHLVTHFNTTANNTELKNLTLGDPLQEALPIKHAEIAIYDTNNKIVQCGRTDDQGNLKATNAINNLVIPATPGQYTVRVFSRVLKTFPVLGNPDFILNLSIKKDKYTNQLYSLEKSVTVVRDEDVSVDLIAYARQTESKEISGGAFNILNSIYTSYSYISVQADADTRCLNNKINVYWKAGFNAFQYYYSDQDPTTLSSNSFYNQDGDKGLYITGGRLGNTSIENTDHFDDYVVIHELGHLIEDRCGQLLSPGGSHVLIARIDPRLAWAEGWANYFAAQVMYNYIDQLNPEFETKMTNAGFSTSNKWTFFSTTFGLSDSELNIGNGSGIMFDLKKPGNNPDAWQEGEYEGRLVDKVDPLRYFGEGHFREGAITRGLFKITNACGATCATLPTSFSNVWKSMDKIDGAGRSDIKFKSSHDIIESIKNYAGGNWFSNLKSFSDAEALHISTDGHYLTNSATITRWNSYGKILRTLQGSGCNPALYIEPRSDDPILTATNSDQRYSNHFYTFDPFLLTGVDELNVEFIKGPASGGTNTEFDILLLKENYVFNSDYTCTSLDSLGNCKGTWQPARTVTTDVVRHDRRSGLGITTKRIKDLKSLNINEKYLLNIRAFTAGKTLSSTTEYQYVIRDQSGNYVCP